LYNGHHVICCVRDAHRFNVDKYPSDQIGVIEVNFLKEESLSNIPAEIDVAFYLIHSMSTGTVDFEKMEAECANNFVTRVQKTQVKQVIYLSGIVNESHLSKHLQSRKTVEKILSNSTFALTTLRAGIIIGSGSASFEIIRTWWKNFLR